MDFKTTYDFHGDGLSKIVRELMLFRKTPLCFYTRFDGAQCALSRAVGRCMSRNKRGEKYGLKAHQYFSFYIICHSMPA